MKVKSWIKNNFVIMKLYNKLLPLYCIVFTKHAVKMLYKQTFQKPLDLKNPRDLNEKINWLKVYKYKNDPLVIQCADKWAMREYVSKCGYSTLLNDVYGVYDSAEEIEWASLPDQFALKFNKAAGMNIICSNKSMLNEMEVKCKVAGWFKAEYGERFCELHYRKAKSKVICEKYLGTAGGEWPIDYKVHCLNGTPVCTMICTERKDSVKFTFVDNDYNKIDCNTNVHAGGELGNKPACFEEMIKIASVLSKPFPLVRIDYYVVGGKLYLGEMTFTPQGGYIDFINQEYLNKLGDLLVLPK